MCERNRERETVCVHAFVYAVCANKHMFDICLSNSLSIWSVHLPVCLLACRLEYWPEVFAITVRKILHLMFCLLVSSVWCCLSIFFYLTKTVFVKSAHIFFLILSSFVVC